MNNITQEKILDCLNNIILPGTDKSLVDLDMVSSIVITKDKIAFIIDLKDYHDLDVKYLKNICEQMIKSISHYNDIRVIITAENEPKVAHSNKLPKPKLKLPGVKHIILITSCKGGVGKSTLTAGLAINLAAKGIKVGLIDADIYGPSIPYILDAHDQPQIKNNKIIPIERNAINFISIGNLIESDKATIWRGPMISKAIHQLLFGSNWQDIDILLIDMPPGTGDVYLSIIENYFISGIVLISTPQQLAINDVMKSIDLFKKMQVEILGLVENMSSFKPSGSNERYSLFGPSKIADLAKKEGLTVLDSVDFNADLVKIIDSGEIFQSAEIIDMLYGKVAEQLIIRLNL